MGVKSTGSHPTTTKADGHLLEYFRQNFGAGGGGTNAPPGGSGLTATGGIISDYTDGPTVYRAHIFTSSGTFNVTAPGDFGDTVEYLVVAGGGAGAAQHGGGGGAGGYRTATGFSVSSSPGAYTVTIGAGGAGVASPGSQHVGNNGNPSVFGSITSVGGGGGGKYSGHPSPGGHPGGGAGVPGGSGGGGGNHESTTKAGGAGQDYPGPNQQGFPGGSGEGEFGDTYRGGGGGGAGGAGTNGTTSPLVAGTGGVGLRTTIAGPIYPIGTPGPGPTTGGWLAGGGGGGAYSPGTPQNAAGGAGGGGNGGWSPQGNPGTLATDATQNTGGGGGGSGRSPDVGGSGGSGIVVVRYRLAESPSGTAKATGGAISFYGGKTIHTFTTSGNFVNSSPITDAEFVLVGGGGGGGYPQGGGGGAGGMVVHTGPFTIPAATNAVVVGGGGSGLPAAAQPANPGTTTTLTFPGAPATYSAYRGGGSGPAPLGAEQGGSGGGGSYNGGVGKAAANPAPNPGATEYGNAGGNHDANSSGGGGGGAGQAGSGADGGRGRQLPTTYRNPVSAGILGTPGPDPGGFYVAGGGQGFYGPTGNPRDARAGGGGGGPITYPQPLNVVQNAFDGQANTGGGGAGPYITSAPNTYSPKSGNGGSGIVLIAYPS